MKRFMATSLRFRVVNAAVGHLCSALLTGAYRPYVYLHTQHHLHTNHWLNDPDVWCGGGPRQLLPLRWATQDIGYLKFYCQRWHERPLLERCDLVGSALLFPGDLCGQLVGYRLHGSWQCAWGGLFQPAWHCLFWRPRFLGCRMNRTKRTNAYRATAVRSSPWLTWAMLGQNFHLVHHLDPRIPFYRLSDVWRRDRLKMVENGAVDRSE